MSYSYKAVFKSLVTTAFTEQHFFSSDDEAARAYAKDLAKFPLTLSALIAFEGGNKTRDIGLSPKPEIHQFHVKDDYTKD